MWTRLLRALAGAVLVCLAGCGGGESSPPPVSGSPPPSTPPVSARPGSAAPAQGGTSAVARSGPGAAQSAKPAAAATPDPYDGAPAEQRMEMGPEIPNFEVVSVGEPDPRDLFDVLPPPAGADSTYAVVFPGESESPTGAPGEGVLLPEGFAAVAGTAFSDDGWPLRIRCDKDGAEMALVPAGPYEQGIDGAAPDAGPKHLSVLDAFYMDVAEVTLSRYELFRHQHQPQPPKPLNEGAPAEHPVTGIRWSDAVAYAKWSGKSLPTESEWEKAARGPQSFLYPWGNGRPLWERPRTPGQIDPVRSFRGDLSVYGVFDMAGNAREWCADWYADAAYQQAQSKEPGGVQNGTGPQRPSLSSQRVVRGGVEGWELWRRGHQVMGDAAADIGFRCVLRPGRQTETAEPERSPTAAPRRGAVPPPRTPRSGF